MACEEYNLKPLQDATLRLAKEFIRVCDKYGFKYYVAYGTALGAMRHHGFIPWDDDFDVVMPRLDYNEFVKIIDSELPEGVKFSRGGEDDLSPVYFSHILDNRPCIKERLSIETNLNLTYPPYMDIFVLDGMPDKIGLWKSCMRKRRIVRFVQVYRHPESAGCVAGGKVKVLLMRILGMLFSWGYKKSSNNREMCEIMDDSLAKVFPYDSSANLVELNFFRNAQSRLLPRSWFEPARKVMFEDVLVRVPFKVEEILSRYYGDYMKFPDEESRVPAHQMRVNYKEHI